MTSRPVLLSPQREEKEVYPYRRVWRTASIEAFLLVLITVAVLLAFRFLPIRAEGTLRRVASFALALAPFILWYLISYRAELRAIQPRTRMFTAVILGALVASGIGIPLAENVFAVDEWLPTASGLSRIIGYTLTVGIVQEFLKYAALRYSIWPGAFHTRLDGIAYAVATAIGYATAVNLTFVLTHEVDVPSIALRVTEITLAQVAIGAILGYGLVELKRPDVSIFLLPGALLFAGGVVGLSVVFRGGLVVGGISTTSTANNAVYGLGMAIFLIVVFFSSLRFLIANADERDLLRRTPE